MGNNDYSGYNTCMRISDILKTNSRSLEEVPAIKYCLDLNESGYQGYLPSSGQLKILFNNLNMINYIFDKLNTSIIGLINVWSSTESTCGNAWCWIRNHLGCFCKNANEFYVLPFFHVNK